MENYYNNLPNDIRLDEEDDERYVQESIRRIQQVEQAEKGGVPEVTTPNAAQPQAQQQAAEPPKPTKTNPYADLGVPELKPEKKNILQQLADGYAGGMQLTKELVEAPAAGILDTVFDAMGLVPGLKKADEWWDSASKPIYEREHGLVKATRQISGIVIPSLTGGGMLAKGGAAVANASKINALARMNKLGTIAAHIGADVGVTAISSQSVEEDNAAGALEDWLGVNIPWATRDGDSADVRRAKHIMEAAGLNVGAELLQGLFAMRRGMRVVPTSEAAAEALAEAPEAVPVIASNADEVRQAAKAADNFDPRVARIQAEQSVYQEALDAHNAAVAAREMGEPFDVAALLDDQSLQLYTEQMDVLAARAAKLSGDPVVNAMDDAAEATAREQLDEANRVLVRDPNGEQGYNAFVNEPAIPESRAVINTDVNPNLAAVDHALIQRNLGTTYGRARGVVTKGQMDFMQAAPGSQRAADLAGLYREEVVTNTQAIVNGKRLSGQDIKQAVDNLVESVFSLGDGGMDGFLKNLEAMRTNTYQGIKVLGEEEFVISSKAFKEAFDQMFNPDTVRASALYTQQMADDIADTARAANIIGEAVDPSRQQEIVLERLEILASELRINQYVAGRSLEYKKLVKNGASNAQLADWMVANADTMPAKVDEARAQAKQLMTTLREMGKSNPELLRPFMNAYDLTRGEVDTIGKLNRFAEKHVDLFKRMIYDDSPEIPSLLLEQLNSVRYNNVLSGLAAVRAAAGNATNLMLKPMNAMVGSLARGRMDEFRRSMAIYGSVHETFQRAFKHMGNEWKFALDDYDGAMMRGRVDLQIANSNNVEFMESMAEAWRAEGKFGLVAKWNMTKMLKWWNGQAINRYGTTAMYAMDGFVKSAMATMSARAQAYDDLLRSGKGQIDNFSEEFASKSRQLYSEMFDDTGLLTDKAAKMAAGEISLNLDNKMVHGLEGLMKQYPAMRSLFMFPRTGINALELSWSYVPVSPLGAALGKQRQVFKALTQEDKIAALAAHGIEKYSDEAFEAIKSEYIGRQIMGSSVVFGIGMMAFNGQVTGNGPQDAAQKRRMIEAGWAPKSIKVGDRWVSYEGLEPFETVMALTADAVYQSTRVDQAVTEDWLRKISFAISSNITGKTFLSGLQPLTDIIAGQNEAALARFTANFADSMLPMSGARHVFARAVKPQLQDVENDFMAYLQNYNRYIPEFDEAIPDAIDVYTGKPINDTAPIESAYNALMPFFKTRGGTEPWREWMMNTGWAGLQKPRVNPTTGEPLSAAQRQWINNWVATNGGLAKQIDDMRTAPSGFWDKKMKEYKNQLKQFGPNAPIKEWIVHQELDKIHDAAFSNGWNAWKVANAEEANIGVFKDARTRAMNLGDTDRAASRAQDIETLQNYYKQ